MKSLLDRLPAPGSLCGVHIDLKGMQYRPAYLPAMLADLADLGVNTLLVEYEDVFPFAGLDIALDRDQVWSHQTLNTFQENAQKLGLEIIPMQQCLGHLEYLLRWDKYAPLAMAGPYLSTIDINNPAAKSVLRDMLEQVIAAHPQSRFVHLGMDEAYALGKLARDTGKDLLELYLGHLDELCTICDKHGKIPLVFSDMIQDNLSQAGLEKLTAFKQRVVLCPWDYAATCASTGSARLGGRIISKEWLNAPGDPEAPVVGPGVRYVEDWDEGIKKVVGPYLHGKNFAPLFQADLLSSLGFAVVGLSGVRASADGTLMPDYNGRAKNVGAWAQAVERTGALGQIATSWARGNTFCRPNFPAELTWTLIENMCRSMGKQPRPFFEGLTPETVQRILATMGRCRLDWRLEEEVATEMEALAPQVGRHRHEWEGLALLGRLMALHRRTDIILNEVDDFHCNIRPTAKDWQRRIDAQKAVSAELKQSQKAVRAHFQKNYQGQAFEEWVSALADWRLERLEQCTAVCLKKQQAARAVYAQKG